MGALPTGLTLSSSTGQITGTPTTAELRSFTLRVDDSSNQNATRDFTIAIGAPTPLVERVSLARDGGQANSDSGDPALSNDGRFVAFTSFATNLVPTDTNNFADVFLRDRVCQSNLLVSVSRTGAQGNNQSFSPAISGFTGGHVFVAYVSDATNLVPGDTNQGRDVFVTAVNASSCPPVIADTIRVSVASDGSQSATDSATISPSSQLPSISANGRVVAYQSNATNLAPAVTNAVNNVYVTELAFSGSTLSVSRTRRVSLFQARLSIRVGRTTADIHTADSIGRSALAMTANEHVGREVHIFGGTGAGQVRGISFNTATTLFVDRNWKPVPAADSVFRILSRELVTADIFSSTTLGNSALSLTDDEHIGQVLEIVAGAGQGQQRRVTDNDATTFTVDPPWSPVPDNTSVFRLLRQGGNESVRGRVSPDGGFVLFDSGSAFEEEDNNNSSDVFLHHLATGNTERLSQGPLSRPGNASSLAAALSGSADRALFLSTATNLAPVIPPTPADIFSETTIGNSGLNLAPGAHVGQFVIIVEGTGAGQSQPITVNTTDTLTVGNAFSTPPDSTSVFILSGDTNAQPDLYVFDRSLGRAARVNLAQDGSQGNGPADVGALLSASGTAVVFSTSASNLVDGDRNNLRDIYLRNRATNATLRISWAMGDTNPNGESVDPALSLDGSTIAFSSTANNLVPSDTNNARDIFLVSTGIADPPAFAFSKPAAARVGLAYSTQLSVLGGSQPLFWSVVGGALPPGLFLDPNSGELAGVPQKAGRYQFTLLVNDGARPPRQVRRTVTLLVEP